MVRGAHRDRRRPGLPGDASCRRPLGLRQSSIPAGIRTSGIYSLGGLGVTCPVGLVPGN